MDNNELNDVIKELILKFKNTIPKENERLIEAFENYLLSILSECKNNNESKEFIIFHLNRIADKFISYNIEQKKRELLEDENLEEIRKMSGEIFNKSAVSSLDPVTPCNTTRFTFIFGILIVAILLY